MGFKATLYKAGARAIGGGVPGALAMLLQVRSTNQHICSLSFFLFPPPVFHALLSFTFAAAAWNAFDGGGAGGAAVVVAAGAAA